MPRQARVVAAGAPHHITHRGNNRQDVFLSDEDRRRYQDILLEQLGPCQVELLGWSWMGNHVHLIAVPQRASSLATLIMRVHSRYAQSFNRRYRRSGHLWHSRFFSCSLGPDHLQAAMLYVDRNPVRASLVGQATAYPWSSAAAHVSGDDPTGLLSWDRLRELGGCQDWAARLGAELGEQREERLRQATLRGTPFAGDEFVAKLEVEAGRRLRPGRAGRPPKQKSASAGVHN